MVPKYNSQFGFLSLQFCNFQQSTNTRVEHDIIDWVNAKFESSGKESRISSFQDPRISTALPLIDLIDAIKPGVINYELLQEGGNYEVTTLYPNLRKTNIFYLILTHTNTHTQFCYPVSLLYPRFLILLLTLTQTHTHSNSNSLTHTHSNSHSLKLTLTQTH